MGATFDRDLDRLLKDAGCHLVRHGGGGHAIWFSPITKRHITVPYGIVSQNTANGILKQAGLPKGF